MERGVRRGLINTGRHLPQQALSKEKEEGGEQEGGGRRWRVMGGDGRALREAREEGGRVNGREEGRGEQSAAQGEGRG